MKSRVVLLFKKVSDYDQEIPQSTVQNKGRWHLMQSYNEAAHQVLVLIAHA